MDFFESQEVARKKTGRLVILFACAVTAIIVCVYLVIAGVVLSGGRQGMTGEASPADLLYNPALIAGVVLGTIAVIGCVSLYKLRKLRGGGRLIAESLGGRLVPPQSSDPAARVLLNVVEEMAIAEAPSVSF